MSYEDGVHTKLKLLKLAERLGNVSQACEQLGISRDSFYRYKELFKKGGKAALTESSRRKPNLKNRVGSDIERAVLALSSQQPNWGAARLSKELQRRRVRISAFGIRSIWIRHKLSTKARRIQAMGRTRIPHRPDPRGMQRNATRLTSSGNSNGKRSRTQLLRNDQRNRLIRPEGSPDSETASAFLKAALDLFAGQNYSTVTIKDISAATGMNAALVYYYFGNKEGLFLKVVESTTKDAIDTFEAIRNDAAAPREIVSLWIENHILQFTLMQKLIKISLDYANTHNRTPQIDREIRKFYDIEEEVLGTAIRAGIEQGVFVSLDVTRIIRFISAFLDGVLVRSVMMQEFDVKVAITDLRDLILRQLEVPKSATLR